MALYNTEISESANKVIEKFYQSCGLFDEWHNRLIVSLYSIMPSPDPEPLSILSRFSSNIYDILDCNEVEILLKEAPSVMRKCYARGNKFGGGRDSHLNIVPEMIDLFLKLVEPAEGSRIFLPYAGSAEVVLSLPHCHFEGYELDNESWALSKIVFDVCGIDVTIERCSDSKSFIEQGRKYDAVFTFPPILPGKEGRKIEDDIRRIAEHALNENGKMFGYIPMGFCSSRSNWVETREILLKHFCLVVDLGSMLRPMTGIPIGAFVFDASSQSGNIVLVDASSQYFRARVDGNGPRDSEVKVDSILDTINKPDRNYVWFGTVDDLSAPYILSPKRYLLANYLSKPRKGEKLCTLGDIIELVETQPAKGKHSPEGECPVVGMKDLSTSFIDCKIEAKTESERKLNPAKLLGKDSLLLGFANGIFKVGRISGLSDNNPVALMREIVAFNVCSDYVSEKFVLLSILSEGVRLQAQHLASGMSFARLSKEDLLEIQIIVPSKEEQDRLCRKEMERLGIREAGGDLAHMLGMPKDKIDDLLELLKSSATLSTKDRERVQAIDDNFRYMLRLVNIVGMDFSTMSVSSQVFPIAPLLREYSKSLKNFKFSNSYFIEENISLSDEVTVDCDEDIIRVALDTAFRNAYTHGFGKKYSESNKVLLGCKIVEYVEKTYVCITVANNGNPIEPGFSVKDFATRGVTAGRMGNTGKGGYHIYSIAKKYNGFINITASEEWSFILDVLIPAKNISPTETVEKYYGKCL